MPIEVAAGIIILCIIGTYILLKAGEKHEKLIEKNRAGVWIPLADAELILISLKWERIRYKRLIDNAVFNDQHMEQLNAVRGRLHQAMGGNCRYPE